ncbi:hypothetical protein Z042_07670 [Chania multitudinisentens RB-25]|uniref:Uncharacterized protein n=1 Tax=Chania multitudinisentens RB-25 TaxID=1441930 RepID=W0LAT9_9GAMM|nr:hypothetical protein [Chania multitudinisentens]AHG19504.1 hypothetical protein Z042_07670 [Chania multitudinisentens RB-25]
MKDNREVTPQSEAEKTDNWAYPDGVLVPSPELPQLHFVMKARHHTFLLSLENILLCLQEAERQGEVPTIEDIWWVTLQGKFDVLR